MNILLYSISLTLPAFIGAERAVASSLAFRPSSASCKEAYFTQPLDHFDQSNEDTFQQRYFWNDTFFEAWTGPVLYYTGNEADVTLYVNATGLMWENAERLGALLVWGEHRYYGRSVPEKGGDLKFLSVVQALEDHAHLVKYIKSVVVPGSKDSPVIAIGGSYGGMEAAWARIAHAETFHGAIAGSAPILAFDGLAKESAKHAGNESYWKIVTDNATPEMGSAANCRTNVQNAWQLMDGETVENLSRHFKMCTPLTGKANVFALKVFIMVAFDTLAMGNFPFESDYLTNGAATLPAFPYRKACEHLAPTFASSADHLVALGEAAAVYNNATKDLDCFELPSDPDYDGIWDYLWCTENLPQETYFGRDGVTDMFFEFNYSESAINDHCMEKYGVVPNYGLIAELYKGMDGVRGSSNIVFSNGRFDPWRSGGVTDYNSSENSVFSILIENGAHHVDLMFATPHDTEDIRRAREFEVKRIQEWTSAHFSEQRKGVVGRTGIDA